LAQTKQSRSPVLIDNFSKDISLSELEDDKRRMLSVSDDLDELLKLINNLDNIRKKIQTAESNK
jgi:hypothetical protein